MPWMSVTSYIKPDEIFFPLTEVFSYSVSHKSRKLILFQINMAVISTLLSYISLVIKLFYKQL
jgi:hypothetical protein